MVLDTIISNPVYLAGAVAGIAGFAGIQIYKKFTEKESETIDADGMSDKFGSIFGEPADSQGSIIKDPIYINGVKNTPAKIGLVWKAKDLNVDVKVLERTDDGDLEFKDEKSPGVVYRVIEDRSTLSLKIKQVATSLGVSKFLTTYDVPDRLVMADDEKIMLSNDAHFVNVNGVKRQLDTEGMSRAQETAFSTFHEEYIDTAGKIPQQYAVLNNRLSGQLKVEDVKSENILEYKNQENRNEKDID